MRLEPTENTETWNFETSYETVSRDMFEKHICKYIQYNFHMYIFQ